MTMNATSHPSGQPSSNALGRRRDAQILWLLERHPATAWMLVEVGIFASRSRASKRLRRLVQKKQVRIVGTVSLKDGRPEHVYARGRPIKIDNLVHEVQLSRVCFKIHANEVHRGISEVDLLLAADAEVFIGGQRYLLEFDNGTMAYTQIVGARFAKYETCADLVLWVCSSEARKEGLRTCANRIRTTALFATLEQVLRNPHGEIWQDFDGERAALPRGR